jgi:hypothetical protein
MRSLELRGVVTVEGRPVRDAVVELHNPAGDVLTQVQVDAEGHFVFYLAPGSWSLHSWDGHGHRGTAEVTLEGDQGRSTFIDLR